MKHIRPFIVDSAIIALAYYGAIARVEFAANLISAIAAIAGAFGFLLLLTASVPKEKMATYYKPRVSWWGTYDFISDLAVFVILAGSGWYASAFCIVAFYSGKTFMYKATKKAHEEQKHG